MSDDIKKKKKRNRNKGKKKGNNTGPASANKLEFKVDIASAEDENENQEVVCANDEISEKLDSATGTEQCFNVKTGENEGCSQEIEVQEVEDIDPVSTEEFQETEIYRDQPEIHTHSVITTTTTTYETTESADNENVVVDVESSTVEVDDAVAETISHFLDRKKEPDHPPEPDSPAHHLMSHGDSNVVVDVQSSPWRVDTDVQEIVEHNKRVRMTKITKSRRVIITKTETGEEIETVVEEEDDDSPEVIGEIGAFGETENETVEIQRIVKKRRITTRKTVDGEEVETVVSEDDLDHEHDISYSEEPYQETTLVTTRKVIITQNEMGEDVETIVEENQPAPEGFQEESDSVTEVVKITEDDSGTCQLVEHDVSLTEQNEIQDDVCSDEDEDVVKMPVEVTTVESEVDFHAVLGPADEEHEKALELQDQRAELRHEAHKHQEDAWEEPGPQLQGKEIVSEEFMEIRRDGKTDHVKFHDSTEPSQNPTVAAKHIEINQPMKKLTLRVKPQAHTKQELTEEQKQMLSEVQMPEVKNVLDDWVLVNFTAKEVTRFAELMRFRPGWMDDDPVEIQRCCKIM